MRITDVAAGQARAHAGFRHLATGPDGLRRVVINALPPRGVVGDHALRSSSRESARKVSRVSVRCAIQTSGSCSGRMTWRRVRLSFRCAGMITFDARFPVREQAAALPVRSSALAG